MGKNVTFIEQYVINQVRKKRKKLGLSQADLAEILNVTPGFIGKIESSKHSAKYNLNHLYRLSQHFDCNLQAFFPKRGHREDE